MLTNAKRESVQAKKKASSAISKLLKIIFFFFFFFGERIGGSFFCLFPCALIGEKPAIT
jgi:hypothetical protein